jgi:DNA-binding protein H-NS
MAINLESLSPRELDALINRAKKRKTTLSKRKPIAAVRKKVRALAESEGYSIAELFGTGTAAAGTTRAAGAGKAKKAAAGRKLGKVAPKYRNPANPKETWTGRGKQPRWLAAETAKGRKLEEFLIK